MSKSYLTIINPAAGGGRAKKNVAKLLYQLHCQGVATEVCETEKPGQATTFARQGFANGYRKFMVVGGDGTAFEVINGLFPEALQTESPPLLAFLPQGTGNSFLRDFTHKGGEHSLACITNQTKQACDVIELRHTQGSVFYINLASFGFVADVAVHRNMYFSSLGTVGYILAVLATLRSLQAQPYTYTLNAGLQKKERLTFLSVNNSKYTGGRMMMAPDAHISDGAADLIRVCPFSRWELLKAFPKIFRGTHVDQLRIKSTPIKTMTFDFLHSINVMVDGEVLKIQPTGLTVLNQALEIQV